METAHAFPVALCDRLVRAGAIAVLVIDKVDHALPTARALWEGGRGNCRSHAEDRSGRRVLGNDFP